MALDKTGTLTHQVVEVVSANGTGRAEVLSVAAAEPVRLGRAGFVPVCEMGPGVTRMQAGGASLVLVERRGELLGAIAVRDELRQEAADAVAELHRLGMATVMLTGDNAGTARALAHQAGVGAVQAELLPTDKAAVVERLNAASPTAMVGDGINGLARLLRRKGTAPTDWRAPRAFTRAVCGRP